MDSFKQIRMIGMSCGLVLLQCKNNTFMKTYKSISA